MKLSGLGPDIGYHVVRDGQERCRDSDEGFLRTTSNLEAHLLSGPRSRSLRPSQPDEHRRQPCKPHPQAGLEVEIRAPA